MRQVARPSGERKTKDNPDYKKEKVLVSRDLVHKKAEQ